MKGKRMARGNVEQVTSNTSGCKERGTKVEGRKMTQETPFEDLKREDERGA